MSDLFAAMRSFGMGGPAALVVQLIWQHLGSALAVLMIAGMATSRSGFDVLQDLLPAEAGGWVSNYQAFLASIPRADSSALIALLLVAAVFACAVKHAADVVPGGRAPATFWIAAFHVSVCGVNWSFVICAAVVALLYFGACVLNERARFAELPTAVSVRRQVAIAFVHIAANALLIFLTTINALFGQTSPRAQLVPENNGGALPIGASVS